MASWKVQKQRGNISTVAVCELKARLTILQTINKKDTVMGTKKALNKKQTSLL
jgi:hypothetical protein